MNSFDLQEDLFVTMQVSTSTPSTQNAITSTAETPVWEQKEVIRNSFTKHHWKQTFPSELEEEAKLPE